MQPEKMQEAVEMIVQGKRDSILRAAAKVFLANPEENAEEESAIVGAITNMATESGAPADLVATLIVHALAQSYIKESLQNAFGGLNASMAGQKVGNC